MWISRKRLEALEAKVRELDNKCYENKIALLRRNYLRAYGSKLEWIPEQGGPYKGYRHKDVPVAEVTAMILGHLGLKLAYTPETEARVDLVNPAGPDTSLSPTQE